MLDLNALLKYSLKVTGSARDLLDSLSKVYIKFVFTNICIVDVKTCVLYIKGTRGTFTQCVCYYTLECYIEGKNVTY